MIVVVHGPPGAGKTAIAGSIASDLGLPVISKDAIKERLFDTLGWSDRGWSSKLTAASWAVLFDVGAELASAGVGFVLEGNVDLRFAPDVRRIVGHREAVEVSCTARADVLQTRIASRRRHPGHVDDLASGWLDGYLAEREHGPLGVGALLEVDTTDGVRPDEVAAALRRMVASIEEEGS